MRESSEIEERWVYPMPFYVVKLLSEVRFLEVLKFRFLKYIFVIQFFSNIKIYIIIILNP